MRFCFTDLWADQQCCLAKMTRKGWLKSPSWNFLGALLMKINLKSSKHLSLFSREGAWVTHDVVVAYLNIFLYLSMISTLSPDFCFCNVFCHRLMLLYIYSEFSCERGKEKNEARWWKKKKIVCLWAMLPTNVADSCLFFISKGGKRTRVLNPFNKIHGWVSECWRCTAG